MVPEAAQKLNLTGIIANVSSREWVDGFVKGRAAKEAWRKLPPLKEKSAGPNRKTTYYIPRPGGNIIIAMYYPRDRTLFYLQ